MARLLRLEFPGAIYHVTSRGDRREAIFEDDIDRQAFLNGLNVALTRFDAVLFAYCLMDNHYHLVVHTRLANLSKLMQHLNGVYTQAYNRRHKKVGHLFQGRFKGIIVDKHAYLLEVCRYVDLNPVRTRMVRDPGKWPWSSYRAHVGLAVSPPWLDANAIHEYLLGRNVKGSVARQKAGASYAALVAAGKGIKLWEESLAQQIFLGDAEFVTRMQALMPPDTTTSNGIPRQQRQSPAKSIAQYLHHAENRDAAIRSAINEGQHSMTDVAQVVGLSVSRVSRIVNNKEAR